MSSARQHLAKAMSVHMQVERSPHMSCSANKPVLAHALMHSIEVLADAAAMQDIVETVLKWQQ